MDRAALKEIFLHLPEETQRNYETELVDLALKNYSPEFIQLLEALLEDEAEEESIRFAAFCTLCEAYRRRKDYSCGFRLLEECETRFEAHPFYSHIKLLYYVDNFKYEKHEDILTLAKANTDHIPLNAGVWHAFADLTTTAFENVDFSGAQPPASWSAVFCPPCKEAFFS